MARSLICLALALAAAGCEHAADKDALTPKQRTAWEEKRKEVADMPFMIVGYDADEKQWMICVFTDPKLVRYEWRKFVVDLWSKDERDSALALAKRKADSSSIVTTALVDMVSKENPEAVRYYFRDGEVMKTSNRAPRPDLEASLTKYLVSIQTNPQIVKPPTN